MFLLYWGDGVGFGLEGGGEGKGEGWEKGETHFIPTPPATKTTFSISLSSISAGGQMKLPPTLTSSSRFRIVGGGCQSHFAGGFSDL